MTPAHPHPHSTPYRRFRRFTRPLKAGLLASALVLGVSPAPPALAAELEIPDFTRGDTIPEDAPHDWNLGATGARGWMFSDRLVTTDARQVMITQVHEGSPADGVLEPGDVILGVAGQPFAHDPRTELGRALTAAESNDGGGELRLTRWRDGDTGEVTLRLPVLGDYGPRAPFDCAKSERILELGLDALAERMAAPGYRPNNVIVRSLNALALLAGGDPEHLPLVRREAQELAGLSSDGFQTWWYGYAMLLLAEYVLATGDESVMPGLRRLAMESAEGQSLVGSWGHRFAGDDGRLVGYGMMNSPGVPLTIGLIMARAAGVEGPEIDQAIDRSAKLIRHYAGKGAVPYGDHDPWTQTHEDNGKCGMAAVMFSLLNETPTAEYFAKASLASHGAERDTGHTGNFFNLLWAMPGVAQFGPHATGAWMEEFGGWYFDLARQWDGSFLHQGPPQQRHDSYRGWDATGAYLLAYAHGRRGLFLTGKQGPAMRQLDREAAEGLIEDGRGWDNKDRTSAYDAMADGELLERLGSWSPSVRERAAAALARRRDEVGVEPLVALLGSERLEARYGACEALRQRGGRGTAEAVPVLRGLLGHEDLWLRVKAAEALAAMGQAAMAALPELLEMIAGEPSEEDPRHMEQRYLSYYVFGRMLRNHNLEGVDRGLLREAVAAGLDNQDGRARGSVANIYSALSYEDIEPLLPVIHEAIVTPAPSGIMFADQVRIEGLRVLAANAVEEGMRACVDYLRSQNRWASEKRTPDLLELLVGYGAHAKALIPELQEIADQFEAGEDDFPRRLSRQKAAAVREAIRAIEASEDRPEVIGLGAG